MNKNIRQSTVCCFSCVTSGADEALYSGVLITSHHTCNITCEVYHCIILVDIYRYILLQCGVVLNKWIWSSDFCIDPLDPICNSLCNSSKFKTVQLFGTYRAAVMIYTCSYPLPCSSYSLPCTCTNLSVEKCLDTILSHCQCPLVCLLTCWLWVAMTLQILYAQAWPPKARSTN